MSASESRVGLATGSRREESADPAVSRRQWQWLSACLHRNRRTEIGRHYNFARIDSPQTYRNNVPVVSYEDIADDIDRIAAGERDVLMAGRPVAFERTGGSSGGSKLMPYSAASLADFRGAISPWLRRHLEADRLQGSAYWAVSPATRQPEVTAGGIAIGIQDSEYVDAELAPAMLERSAMPGWVGRLRRVSDWQLATAYWLVRRVDLSFISVWSPTFMLSLLDAIEARAEQVAALLTAGGTIAGNAVAADADALSRLRAYAEQRDTKILWPNLRLLSCWADAASRPFFAQLAARIAHSRFEPKGLISTESVVTVPDGRGRLLLAADHGFFEFMADDGRCLLANALCQGSEYEVIVTTAGGLYRYRTGDMVRCDADDDDVPSLSFLGRGNLTSDLVGEKLTESFVVQCLDGIPGFRMLIPALDPAPHYVLVAEPTTAASCEELADRIEDRLRVNPQYTYARDIGQLGKLRVRFANAPLQSYIEHASPTQARLGDIKVPALRPEPDWMRTFTFLRH